MCGIVGIVSSSPVAQQIYDSLGLLQHRGQDSTGIATSDGPTIHMHKARGQVREAYRTRDMRSLLGTMGLGHVRYTTQGDARQEQETQPFYVNAPYGIVLVHNGNLTNVRELSRELLARDRRHLNTNSDTELLVNVLANELQSQADAESLQQEIRLISGHLKDFARQVKAGLGQADWESRRKIVAALVRRVEVEGERVRVVHRVDTSPIRSDGRRTSSQHCPRRSDAKASSP